MDVRPMNLHKAKPMEVVSLSKNQWNSGQHGLLLGPCGLHALFSHNVDDSLGSLDFHSVSYAWDINNNSQISHFFS